MTTDEKLLLAVERNTYVLGAIAKELALIAQYHCGSLGQFASPIVQEMENFLNSTPVVGLVTRELEKAEARAKEEVAEPLVACEKCGGKAMLVHPAFDGGAYASCEKCHFAPQVETWSETDAGAARKWNALMSKMKAEKTEVAR